MTLFEQAWVEANKVQTRVIYRTVRKVETSYGYLMIWIDERLAIGYELGTVEDRQHASFETDLCIPKFLCDKRLAQQQSFLHNKTPLQSYQTPLFLRTASFQSNRYHRSKHHSTLLTLYLTRGFQPKHT